MKMMQKKREKPQLAFTKLSRTDFWRIHKDTVVVSYLPDLLIPLPDAAPPIDDVEAARPVMEEKSEKFIATRDLNKLISIDYFFPILLWSLLFITALFY